MEIRIKNHKVRSEITIRSGRKKSFNELTGTWDILRLTVTGLVEAGKYRPSTIHENRHRPNSSGQSKER